MNTRDAVTLALSRRFDVQPALLPAATLNSCRNHGGVFFLARQTREVSLVSSVTHHPTQRRFLADGGDLIVVADPILVSELFP